MKIWNKACENINQIENNLLKFEMCCIYISGKSKISTIDSITFEKHIQISWNFCAQKLSTNSFETQNDSHD